MKETIIYLGDAKYGLTTKQWQVALLQRDVERSLPWVQQKLQALDEDLGHAEFIKMTKDDVLDALSSSIVRSRVSPTTNGHNKKENAKPYSSLDMARVELERKGDGVEAKALLTIIHHLAGTLDQVETSNIAPQRSKVDQMDKLIKDIEDNTLLPFKANIWIDGDAIFVVKEDGTQEVLSIKRTGNQIHIQFPDLGQLLLEDAKTYIIGGVTKYYPWCAVRVYTARGAVTDQFATGINILTNYKEPEKPNNLDWLDVGPPKDDAKPKDKEPEKPEEDNLDWLDV